MRSIALRAWALFISEKSNLVTNISPSTLEDSKNVLKKCTKNEAKTTTKL